MKKNFNWKKLIVIIAIAVAVIAAGLFALIKVRESQHKTDLKDIQEISRAVEEESGEEEPENPINFDEVKKTNEDIVAWIEVPGTVIDYPILQSSEDMEEDFYLNHNLDGSGGYPGCIYIQKCNSADFSDPVTVVYGHNMKDGTMFKDLHKFQDLSFFEENTDINVYTPDDVKKYRIVAATTYDDRLIPDAFNNFKETTDVLEFLGSVASQGSSVKNHMLEDVDIYGASSYIVLSTCTSDPTVRYIVVGMAIDSE